MTELWQLALLLGVGCVAGFLNVLAGGGSLLTLPAMIFLGLPPSTANGTNRIAILAQNVAAVAGFRKKGFSDFPLSLRLAAFGVPGAVAGAIVAIRIDPDWFKRLLALIMIAVLVTVLWPRKRPGKPAARDAAGADAGSFVDAAARARDIAAASAPEAAAVDAPVVGAGPSSGDDPSRAIWADIWMLAIGFYIGFIQAGVGFIIMAVLQLCLRLDLVRVNMHKVFLVGLLTVPAFVVFLAKGEIAWLAGVALAAGNAAGGWIGSHVAVRRGEKVIKIVFALAVIATAVKLLVT